MYRALRHTRTRERANGAGRRRIFLPRRDESARVGARAVCARPPLRPLLLHNRTRAADGGSPPPSSPTWTRLLLLECLATAAPTCTAEIGLARPATATVRSAVRPFADMYSH